MHAFKFKRPLNSTRIVPPRSIQATAEEERANKIALTPLAALPEELILFQRVLTLLRGLCTQVRRLASQTNKQTNTQRPCTHLKCTYGCVYR